MIPSDHDSDGSSAATDGMTRAAAGWLGFVHGGVLGYTLHRLIGRWMGEPDPRAIIAAEHVGFYWRAATALWWACALAALAARVPELAAPLRRTLVPMVVLCALALMLNP